MLDGLVGVLATLFLLAVRFTELDVVRWYGFEPLAVRFWLENESFDCCLEVSFCMLVVKGGRRESVMMKCRDECRKVWR